MQKLLMARAGPTTTIWRTRCGRGASTQERGEDGVEGEAGRATGTIQAVVPVVLLPG